MRAAKVTEKGKVELVDVPEPEPGPGQVRVRVLQCGVCGSDLHVYRAEWATGSKIGHEICGVVEKVGEGVREIAEGARVCGECFAHCGHCRFCRQGDYNLCESISFFGWQEHGALAEKTLYPAEALYEAPESLSDAEVMMVEPLAVAFRAVSRTAAAPGRSLGIMGAGTIGLLCAAAARAAGASPVLVTAKRPHQAAMARELGADQVMMIGAENAAEAMRDANEGSGLDAAIDTVARNASLSTALSAVRKQGRVVVVAGITGPISAALGPVVGGEVEVTGSQCYAITEGKPDFARAMELIESGQVDARRLVTHTLPLDRIAEAFQIADDKSTGSIKVAVRMPD